MVDFAKFKKSSADLSRLAKALEDNNKKGSNNKDDRLYYPERDKAGNASVVIRFLPAPAVDGDDGLPWVRMFSHGFQGPTNKWYIENSLTTLEQPDPVSEYNSFLWNSTTDDDHPNRKLARKQKRQLQYYSNIVVVSDPKHPENERKLFLFRYGKKIYDKINMLMNPEFEGDTQVDPFNFWTGRNFRLRIRKVDGQTNYDSSSFEDNSTAFSTDDAYLERLWKESYSLLELKDIKHFKSYDVLKAQLEKTLDLKFDDPSKGPIKASRQRPAAPPPVRQQEPVEDDDDTTLPHLGGEEDVDSLEEFANLA